MLVKRLDDDADRVRRARLPGRLRMEGLPGHRHRLRPQPPAGHGRGAEAAEAALHARRPRPPTATTRTSTATPACSWSARSASTGSRRCRSSSTRPPPSTPSSGASSSPTRSSSSARTRPVRLVLGDEALTPDSSRFWPADEYATGGSPPSYDKQYVRDWLETLDWDKTPPGPEIPDDVVAGTRARYVEAYERLTGGSFDAYLASAGWVAMRVTVTVRPREGILDPQGEALRRSLAGLGYDVTDVRAGQGLRPRARGGRRGRRPPDRRRDLRAGALEPADRGLRGGRMTRVGVLVFPGSCDDRDALRAVELVGAEPVRIWHGDDDLSGADAVIVPGGFSFGDHLRCGALAALSPAMAAVRAHADAGGPVLGVCNGFQVLTEAGLLPGVLRPNASLRFRCHDAALLVERESAWLPGAAAGDRLSIPIKHHDGGVVRPARAGRRARAARPGAAPLRPEPQRLRRLDRVRHQRARQRRRAHAAPRARRRRAARIDRRPPPASGAARPGARRRSPLSYPSSRSVRQKSERTNATNAVPASA